MFRIWCPFPQKDASDKPMIAITTTEQAGGTAWLPPRNCVAKSIARVELCMPVHRLIVRETFSSCLQNGNRGTQYPRTKALTWKANTGNRSRNPSMDTIRLLFKANGLPMHSDVHTMAIRGNNARILSTKLLAYVFRLRPSTMGRITTYKPPHGSWVTRTHYPQFNNMITIEMHSNISFT